MMHIVLLGPPGSGKGTQAKMIAKECRIPHISTGEMLREAADEDTDLGRQAKGYMEAGTLVPDAVMISIVRDRLGVEDCRSGFLLDGFPRTLGQAHGLEDVLKENEASLDAVLSIEVEAGKIIERLSNRRLCRGCGRDHNLIGNPPRRADRCDDCGDELYQREDDRPETIAKRLEVYQAQTAPVKVYYSKAGLLREIDGNGGIEEVFGEIASRLDCAGG